MPRYWVNNNEQPNGDHEVHKQGCSFLSLIESKKYLGIFTICKEAVKEAKKTYPKADGCAYCSPECHKR